MDGLFYVATLAFGSRNSLDNEQHTAGVRVRCFAPAQKFQYIQITLTRLNLGDKGLCFSEAFRKLALRHAGVNTHCREFFAQLVVSGLVKHESMLNSILEYPISGYFFLRIAGTYGRNIEQ
jgi:hypothetical protein